MFTFLGLAGVWSGKFGPALIVPETPTDVDRRWTRKALRSRSHVSAVTVNKGMKSGDGFLSELSSVHAVLRDGTSVDFLIKTLPHHLVFRGWAVHSRAHEKEFLFYSRISKAFRALGDEAGVKLSIPPFLFGVHHGDQKIMLGLEDLRSRGYSMANKVQGLSLEQCEGALTSMADFHALSLAHKRELQNRGTTYEKEYPVLLRTMVKVGLELGTDFFGDSVENLIGILEKDGPEAEEKVRRLRKFRHGALERFVFHSLPREPLALLRHGDFWCNNILLKRNGNAYEAVLLDFQLIEYGLPCLDLLYFLLSSTNHELRQEHQEGLLRFYWNRFQTACKKLGLDIEEEFQYGWENFLEDFDGAWAAGFNLIAGVLPVMLNYDVDTAIERTSDDPTQVTDMLRECRDKDNQVLRGRLLGVVGEAMERGVI